MASGQQDYWYSMLPAKSVLGPGQIRWIETDHKDVGSIDVEDLINYTIPENYKLHITGGVVSCHLPGRQGFSIVVGGVIWGGIYFDQVFVLSHDPTGLYRGDSGEIVKVVVSNHDNVECTFHAILHGFLEEV